MEEFFAQGDRERALGLPISPFMDRTKEPVTTTITKCQVGFINVLVRPLLGEWAAFLGDAADVSPDHPVVVSKFIRNAKEIEFDAVCRDGADSAQKTNLNLPGSRRWRLHEAASR